MLLALGLSLILSGVGTGAPTAAESGWTLGCLLELDEHQLLALYRQCPPAPRLTGRVRGTALVAPGKPLAGPLSRGSRLIWQGKVFDADASGAVNRFFGARVIRGAVYSGASRLDGGPALILDYSQTSIVYRPYRDEVRQVAPGLYLGLMFDRRTEPHRIKQYFALECE